MRIGIVRIGKERDEAAFGKELAALVDAGYQVAAGTGDMLIVRVGDPAGADAGETAQAVTLAVRAKLAGKPMVVTGLTAEEIRSIAATLNGDENIRLTENGGAAEIMSLDLRGRLTGKHAEPAGKGVCVRGFGKRCIRERRGERARRTRGEEFCGHGRAHRKSAGRKERGRCHRHRRRAAQAWDRVPESGETL